VIRFHADAVEEGRRQTAWYARQSADAAARFDAALLAAWDAIEKGPLMWPQDDDGLRRYKLPEFPVRIVYWTDERERRESLIVAIAHSSRKDGYWLSRIE
jgi:plasmid stabilization system protein ParE